MLDGRVSDSIGISLTIIHPEDRQNIEMIDLGDYCTDLEWSAFINDGYNLYCRFEDFNHISMNRVLQQFLLKHSRNNRLYAKFSFGWDKLITPEGKKLRWINEHLGSITELQCPNVDRHLNCLSVNAVDPISRFLIRGDASGKAYRGKIGGPTGVINNVIQTYTRDLQNDLNNMDLKFKVEVDDTNDNNENIWYSMRLSPKYFISSLLDWSPQLSSDNVPWIIQSQDSEIKYKKWVNVKPPKDHHNRPFVDRSININQAPGNASEMIEHGIDLSDNQSLSITQSKLYTGSISTVTGKYVDKITDINATMVNDLNTDNKLGVQIDDQKGFTKSGISGKVVIPLKPEHWNIPEWATYITPIPEHNNGDVGLKYWDYMSGRSINHFVKCAYTVMRMRLTILGDPNFDNIDILGSSSVFLDMVDGNGEPHYLSGRWIVYGFVHKLTSHSWYTYLYLSRLDWNAEAKNIVKN